MCRPRRSRLRIVLYVLLSLVIVGILLACFCWATEHTALAADTCSQPPGKLQLPEPGEEQELTICWYPNQAIKIELQASSPDIRTLVIKSNQLFRVAPHIFAAPVTECNVQVYLHVLDIESQPVIQKNGRHWLMLFLSQGQQTFQLMTLAPL